MDLPGLVPTHLHYVKEIQGDNALIEKLGKNSEHFVTFFECAVADETWSDRHLEYLRIAILLMTNMYYEDKLDADTAQRAIRAIQEHYYFLEKVIPNNFTIALDQGTSEENSLLWGGSSQFLREIIRQECRDVGGNILNLKNLPMDVFSEIAQYVHTGGTGRLEQKGPLEIIPVLKQADEWQLEEVRKICQSALIKFINSGNVVEYLILAHEHRWKILKDGCTDLLNTLDLGVRFEKVAPEHLAMGILNFKSESMHLFEKLSRHITHLICGNDLTEQPGFSEVVTRCPSMICLDISTSYSFTDRLWDIPESLEELDVSKCEWLSSRTLKKLVQICPNLVKISMGNNLQLNYSSWSVLKEFRNLGKLDITRCLQVKDEDFKVILQASREVTHFSLEECSGLSDNAFYELAINIPNLTDLNVGRCNITDGGLIDLAMRCRQLTVLKLSRCPLITDKGVYETVRLSPNLKSIDITRCQFVGKPVLQRIRAIRPYLEVVF